MHIVKRIYCRIFQTAFHIALPILPYREPTLLQSISDLPKLLQENGIRSVLLVTDPSLRLGGATKELEELLNTNRIHCAVYDQTRANPTVHNVEAARAVYLEEKCQALIAFGGGSSIDCGKAIGARIAYPKKSLNQLKGLLRVLKKIPPLIAVPTTAGTGSEVTLAAVITDSEKKYKYTMNDFSLIPRYAVLDPRVTYTLPPHLTATTGMDALSRGGVYEPGFGWNIFRISLPKSLIIRQYDCVFQLRASKNILSYKTASHSKARLFYWILKMKISCILSYS